MPPWVWLGGIVVASTLLRLALGRRVVAPWIMVDELIYSELAKNLADHGRFLIREEPVGLAYGFVYPLLLSPAYALYEAIPDAYAAAKAINAFVMSLVTVPAYFLARRVLPAGPSLVAALLAVSLPALLYTGTLMTENAFYPLFVTAALALVLVLERPTRLRLLALAAVGALAFFTRVQAVVLVPALLTAPLVLGLYEGNIRHTLRRYRDLYAGTLALGGLFLLAEIVRGRSPAELLGAYRAATELEYSAKEVARSFVLHLGELDLALAVVPFLALLLLVGLGRRLPSEAKPFVAAAACLTFWLVLQVAAFASTLVPFRIEERNMFYVAPLFFTALLLWIRIGLPRPGPLAAPVAVAAALLPATVPFAELIGTGAVSDTFALLPWWSVHLWGLALDWVGTVVLAVCLGAAALALLVPRRLAPVLIGVVLTAFALSVQPVQSRIEQASVGALFQGTTMRERDWVDRAVRSEGEPDVAVVYSGEVDRFVVNQNEFFSRSVGRVFHLGVATPGALAETKLTLDLRNGRLLDPQGRPVQADHVLTDSAVPVAGRRLALDRERGVGLFRVRGPLRVTSHVTGIYDDLWSGPRVVYTRFGCVGGSISTRVYSDASLFRAPQTIAVRAGGRPVREIRLAPDEIRRVVVPLGSAGGNCQAAFTISPTRIPGGADQRRLGVHFADLRFLP